MSKKGKSDKFSILGVYKNDFGENVNVAVKVPKMSLFNPETMKDFYKEAATVMSFDHENILFCLGISTESGEAPYLVFEFMQLGDLSTILKQIKDKYLSNEFIQLNQVKVSRFRFA